MSGYCSELLSADLAPAVTTTSPSTNPFIKMFIKRVLALIFHLLPGSSPQSPEPPMEAPSAMDLINEGFERLRGESYLESLKEARAAAAAGTGPQPWDEDWIEYQIAIGDETSNFACALSWQNTQWLIEGLDWALASPQGETAKATIDDPSIPRSEPLNLILDMREALVQHSHLLLREQAKGLIYPEAQQRSLSDCLNRLLHPQEQEA